jgi:WhiB family redox-sensing transcriptional regulator
MISPELLVDANQMEQELLLLPVAAAEPSTDSERTEDAHALYTFLMETDIPEDFSIMSSDDARIARQALQLIHQDFARSRGMSEDEGYNTGKRISRDPKARSAFEALNTAIIRFYQVVDSDGSVNQYLRKLDGDYTKGGRPRHKSLSSTAALAEINELANCKGIDPEIFFPEQRETARTAKEICRACVVRQQCLDYALENNEKFGIWGGAGEKERRRLRRLAARAIKATP